MRRILIGLSIIAFTFVAGLAGDAAPTPRPTIVVTNYVAGRPPIPCGSATSASYVQFDIRLGGVGLATGAVRNIIVAPTGRSFEWWQRTPMHSTLIPTQVALGVQALSVPGVWRFDVESTVGGDTISCTIRKV